MNTETKMEIIFQDKIEDIVILNTIHGIITDLSDSTLTIMLQNGNFMIISTKSLLEIKELDKNDPIG
jgi:hypothetical protein